MESQVPKGGLVYDFDTRPMPTIEVSTADSEEERRRRHQRKDLVGRCAPTNYDCSILRHVAL